MNTSLRLFFAAAGGSLMVVCSASATTHTWTQKTLNSQSWTNGANWDGNGPFVSGVGNELKFYVDATQANSLLLAGTQTISDFPATLSMGTLTLGGKGPNNAAGCTILFGDGTSAWTIGDGSTGTINLNANVWTFDSQSVFYTLPDLTLNAPNVTITGGGNNAGNNFAGNITEAAPGYGFTKSGTSRMTFSGNNTYTGITALNGGILRLGSANALPGGIGVSGGTSALTLNGGVVELGAGDFMRNLGTDSDQIQIIGGTSGFSAYGGSRSVIINNDAGQELVWGSDYFKPTTLVLNAATANSMLWFPHHLDLNGATRTIQVDANVAVMPGLLQTSSGTAGLTKTGGGTLVLTGNSTYNGNTTLSAGVLSVETPNNIGNGSSNLILNGGTLQIRGVSLTSMTGLGHTVSISNSVNVGFDIQNAANTFTVDQILNNSSGTRTLTKSGVGTLVLNKDNTFTGATTATGGGTLVLDYSDSINGNGSKLSNTAALTLNGSALVLKGGSHTEVVGSTTLAAYTGNSISRDGGSAKISLGALSLPTVSSLSISEPNLATTTTANNASGILDLGRVTAGSDFGANDGSGNIVAFTGYTTYTPATATAGSSSVVNQLTGGGAMAATLSSYSLRIANSANSDVLDLNGKNLNLINNGTLLYAGGSDNNYTVAGNGIITSASQNQPFNINIYDGATLTVNARTSGNYASVLKAGKGTLVLGGNNSTVGIMYVGKGVLRVTSSAGLGNTANGTNVQGGAALELANNIAIGAETLSLNGAGISNSGALRNLSGDNSWDGAITTGASGARINSDAGSLTLTGGIATTITRDVTFGGAGNTTVSTSAISGSGALLKDGDGTLTLSAANTYTGGTTVSGGTLRVNNTTGSGTGTGLVTVSAGATLGGSGAIGGAVTIADGGTLAAGNSIESLAVGNLTLDAGALFEQEISDNTAAGADLVHSSGDLVFSGAVTLNLLDTGSHVWQPDEKITLISYGGSLTIGAGAGFSYQSSLLEDEDTFSHDGTLWVINYNDTAKGGNYGDDAFGPAFITMTVAIPEAGTAGLVALGLLLLRRIRFSLE